MVITLSKLEYFFLLKIIYFFLIFSVNVNNEYTDFKKYNIPDIKKLSSKYLRIQQFNINFMNNTIDIIIDIHKNRTPTYIP